MRLRLSNLDSPFAWELLVEWADEYPFVGYCCLGTVSRQPCGDTPVNDFITEMHEAIDGYPKEVHASKPLNIITTAKRTQVQSQFPGWLRSAGYQRVNHTRRPQRRVMEISKILSCLLPHPRHGLGHAVLYEAKNEQGLNIDEFLLKAYEAKDLDDAQEESVALIAQELLASQETIVKCMPICFNLPHSLTSNNNFQATQQRLPQHIALWITFDNGEQTLLPLGVNLNGCGSRPWVVNNLREQYHEQYEGKIIGAVSDFAWDYTRAWLGERMQRNFRGFPLLQTTDTVVLQPVPYGGVMAFSGRTETELFVLGSRRHVYAKGLC